MSGFTSPDHAAAGETLPAVGAASAEPLLAMVIGLLVLVIAGLVAMSLLLRRRQRLATPPVPDPARMVRAAATAARPPAAPRPRARPALMRGGGGGLAIATSAAMVAARPRAAAPPQGGAVGSMVCPTCRTEYHGLTYCTRDARRLVPPEEMLSASFSLRGGGGRSAGLVCMACRRAYEPGLRSCPHDGNELVSLSVYNATRPRRRGATEPANVIARICPVCATKYDLNARFCGHDAGELVVIN